MDDETRQSIDFLMARLNVVDRVARTLLLERLRREPSPFKEAEALADRYRKTIVDEYGENQIIAMRLLGAVDVFFDQILAQLKAGPPAAS